MHVLCAVVINSNGVLQRLDTGLQTEGDLRVSNCVSTKGQKITVIDADNAAGLGQIRHIKKEKLHQNESEHKINISKNNMSVQGKPYCSA